jgi:hypothetical protein
MDPKLDAESRQDDYGLYSDDFNRRPCDAPDPDCLCEECRRPARTEVEYLRERDDRAQSQIVDLQGEVEELREAAKDVLERHEKYCKWAPNQDWAMPRAAHRLRAALAHSEGK